MFHDWVTGPNWAIKSWIVGCSLCVHTQTTERSTKRRLFWPNADANSRELREVSAVPAERGSKQPREPRSVGCSGRTQTQTTERTAKCRLFRSNADVNSRENREVSVVPAERGCKQPREPRSVGCSSRTRIQTIESSAKCRLFQPETDANNREIHEASAVPAGRGCKQPRNQRSAGCSGRMRMQPADIVHEQRLFRHRISIRGRLFSERTIVGSSWR